MSTTYERAPKAIEALVQTALEKYHPELRKEEVTVDTLIVRRTQGKHHFDVHALKRSGYLIDAKIQITSLQDRSRGISDAKLTIDAYEWDRMSDKRKAALIDHELEHLDLVPIKPTKKNGFQTGNKRDDLGRPCLRSRPHDWELTGFKDVAVRHGEHSHEAMQFANFRAEYAQLNLFGPPDLLKIADGNGKAKKVRVPAASKSKACRNRHHAVCKTDGCRCLCHKAQGVEAHN